MKAEICPTRESMFGSLDKNTPSLRTHTPPLETFSQYPVQLLVQRHRKVVLHSYALRDHLVTKIIIYFFPQSLLF